jgi:hypothetical protein
MADERRAMYDRFSDTDKHSAEWIQITKKFLKLAFAGGRTTAESCGSKRRKGAAAGRCLDARREPGIYQKRKLSLPSVSL